MGEAPRAALDLRTGQRADNLRFDADGIPRSTDVSSLSPAHGGLSYRGYRLSDCIAHGSYEQIAWLLLTGELPTAPQLAGFRRQIRAARVLPLPVRRLLESLPARAHPMEVLRSGVSLLGNLHPETASATPAGLCARLLGAMPAMLLYWHHYHAGGRRIATAGAEPSVAAHLLRLLRGLPPDADSARRLELSLLLYAEHVINASSFTARVIASTGGDYHSAIVGALGALGGRAHGGANEDVLRALKPLRSVAQAEAAVRALLQRGERVPGFGHRVYRDVDPRSLVHRELSAQQSAASGDTRLHEVAVAVEALVRERKRLPANVDLYAATLYDALGIDARLFTPLFAIARLPGWTAHVFEQRGSARLMQPTLEETGDAPRAWPAAPASRRAPAAAGPRRA